MLGSETSRESSAPLPHSPADRRTGAQTNQKRAPIAELAKDRALVKATLWGAPSAREAFLERMRYIPRFLARKSHAYSLDREEQLDLSQEIFAAVWRRLPDYRGEAPLEAWIHGFCIRILGSALRRRTRLPRAQREGPSPDLAEPPPAPLDPRLERLAQALSRLDAKHHEIVQLHGIQGLDYQTVAEHLDCSARAARARFQRAIQRLRELMQTSPDTPDEDPQ